MTKWNLEQSFSFEGREVRYDYRGEGASVVIVHGTPWSSFNLRHLVEGISKHFRVYYFDLLGYGQSDKSDKDVSLGIQNRLLDALIDYWQLEKPYVIGHDFGGTTVLRNHILNHREIGKMVLIDPVALSPWGSPFFQHVREYEAAFAGVPDYIHEAIVKAYIKTAAYQSLDDDILEKIASYWSGEQGKAAFYRQIAQADSRYTDEVQKLYQNIQTEVLILWGEEDTWIPIDKGDELESIIPNSKLVTIPQSGHLVIEEKPDVLLHEITAFFDNDI